jgi:hypothetical protein
MTKAKRISNPYSNFFFLQAFSDECQENILYAKEIPM